MVAWVYPDIFTEGSQTGIAVMRGATQNAGMLTGNTSGGLANTLGWSWDNGNGTATGYNSGLYIPSNMWFMLAIVVNTNGGTFYVGNTNEGLITASQTLTNLPMAWGQAMTIGTDTSSIPGHNWGGRISSVMMFSNSLTYAQISTLFDSGLAANAQKPFIFQNPLNVQILSTLSPNVTFTAGGYAGADTLPNVVNGSFWQRNTTGTWVTLADFANGGPANIFGSCVTNASAQNLISTLTVSNITSTDVGSYQLVISNSLDGGVTFNYATSSVATLALNVAAPPDNTFASSILATPGLVAYWPLNETGDPSTGTVEAYDIVGGFNGIYGANAQDGGVNSVLQAAGGANYFSPVPSPSTVFTGFTGIGSSLGSIQNKLPSTFVTTQFSPTLKNANMTIIAWINPKTNEVANTGLVLTRTNNTVSGLVYGPNANGLGYNWNNSAGFNRGQALATNQWYMVAMVITPTSASLLVGGTNGSVSEVVNLGISDALQTWGGAVTIGGDPVSGGPARNFGGYMSSVAIFSNALSANQIENLFLAGSASGVISAPVIAVQPVNTNMMLTPGIAASISSSAFGFGTITAAWQKWNGTAFVPVSNAGDITGATSIAPSLTLEQSTLAFSAIVAADTGSYEVIFNNSAGSATSQVVNVQLIAAPAAGTFAATITNVSYGTVAYWPLSEASDPSLGGVIAWDVMGGFNGVYGVNAQNGAANTVLEGVGGVNYLGAVSGPGASGLIGLPSSGALASLQNVLPNTFVTTAATPSLPGLNSASSLAVPNSTNLSLVGWVYPRTAENAGSALMMMRAGQLGANRTDGLYLNAGPVLTANWDNGGTTDFAGPNLAVSNWNLVGLVVLPGTNIYYVGTNYQGVNILRASMQTKGNNNEPLGGGVAIGGDPGNSSNGTNVDFVSFGGFISSVAMFTNSLTVQQMETLFDAGVSNGLVTPPVMLTNPLITQYELVQGGSLTVNATGYGPLSTAYWTFDNGTGPGPVYAPTNITGTNVVMAGTLWTGSLKITNFQAWNVGSYSLVINNSAGQAVSTPIAISIYSAPAGSFAAAVTQIPGAISLWPLGEAVDPAFGTAIAYDVVGGFNGIYGTNAQDGAPNSQLANILTAGGYPASDYLGAVPGPGAAGLSGLPTTAFASIYNLTNCLVSIPQWLALPGANSPNGQAVTNSTNMTVMLWFNVRPLGTTANTYAWNYAILFGEINAAAGAGQGTTNLGQNGLQLNNMNTGGFAGYDWDNNSSATYGYTVGGAAPQNQWMFEAAAISPSNAVLYLGNPLTGVVIATNTGTGNINTPWGSGIQIGGESNPNSYNNGSAPNENYFNGEISSLAMFTNTLTQAQIVTLFYSGAFGTLSVPPLITLQPSAAIEVISGNTATINSSAFVGPGAAGGYWQGFDGVNWTNLANVTGVISGATSTVSSGLNQTASVSIVLTSATAGAYRVVYTNAGGSTISVASVVSAYVPQPGGFAATAAGIPGLVALWPLNEQVDPSLGGVIAYDVIGGFNGVYGTNAQDGTGNAGLPGVLSTLGLGADYISPVQGPGAVGMTGLPSTAFAPINNLQQTVITVPEAPTIPANNTNMSIILWFNYNGTTLADNYCDLFMEISGSMGAGGNNGAQFNLNAGAYPNLQMAYDWDNDNNSAHGWTTGVYIPANLWSMYAEVISPSNAVLYLCNANGFVAVTNNFANINIPWGGGFQIGGAAAGSGGAANFFGGEMSSAAMFTNTLSIQQISALYAAGTALGNPPPVISANPPFTNYVLMTNGSATITATAYAGPNGGGYWQGYDSIMGWAKPGCQQPSSRRDSLRPRGRSADRRHLGADQRGWHRCRFLPVRVHQCDGRASRQRHSRLDAALEQSSAQQLRVCGHPPELRPGRLLASQ